MRRRTFISVSFAVALHGAAFLALDRFWFLATIHRPSVDRESVIELVPSAPDPAVTPVALAAEVLPPMPAPVAKPEPQPKLKLETKIAPKPEPKPEVIPELVVQSDPTPLAPSTVAVVSPVAPNASTSSTSAIAPVNAAAVITTVNSSSVANAATPTTPMGTPPAYLRKPRPIYPARARLKRQEGVVLLAVEVSANGKPLRVEVETSSGFESLDEAAVMAVRYARIRPEQLDGVPVASHVQVPVRFQLGD